MVQNAIVAFEGAAANFSISSIDENGVFTLAATEGTAAYEAGYRTYALQCQKLRFDYTDALTGTVLSQYKTIDDYSNLIGTEYSTPTRAVQQPSFNSIVT